MIVMARVSNKTAFEESNVENGRIEIDKLEDENFEGQVVIKLRLSTMHFCKTKRAKISASSSYSLCWQHRGWLLHLLYFYKER